MSHTHTHCTPRPPHSNPQADHSPPQSLFFQDQGPSPTKPSHTQPNISRPSTALRELAMPSLSGQPIDFGGGHVGWLPSKLRSMRPPATQPRPEVQRGSKQPDSLQTLSRGKLVRRALIQPVPSFYLHLLRHLPKVGVKAGCWDGKEESCQV